jgi:hypothetical protein
LESILVWPPFWVGAAAPFVAELDVIMEKAREGLGVRPEALRAQQLRRERNPAA